MREIKFTNILYVDWQWLSHWFIYLMVTDHTWWEFYAGDL